MVRLTFDEAFDRLINVEQGFSKDPNDPGNWTGGRVNVGKLKGTKYGIAANTYPDLNIESLSLSDAREIYHRDWWLRAGGDVLDSAILFQLWDFAVNAGMGTAKRLMQRTVGVAEDGQFGPITIAAISVMDLNDLLFRFNANKIRYYTSLSTWATYGKGWMNRTATNLEYCAVDNINLPRSTLL